MKTIFHPVSTSTGADPDLRMVSPPLPLNHFIVIKRLIKSWIWAIVIYYVDIEPGIAAVF
jgi:hypothetical protein